MTQVNLLPAEIKQRQRTRRVTALVISAVAAVLGLLFFVFVLQAARLSQAQEELATQNRSNLELQARVAELEPFRTLQQQLTARQALVTEVLTGQVLWSGVLRDLSNVIPGDMWLTAMTGAVTPPAGVGTAPSAAGTPSTGAAPAAGDPAQVVGQIQFQGVSLDRPVLSKWLTRLEEVDGWVNPWISSSTKQTADGVEFQFTGTVDLSVEATVDGRPS